MRGYRSTDISLLSSTTRFAFVIFAGVGGAVTAVATYVLFQEYEPTVGRLLVFCIEGQGAERKVNLVAEEETRGAVYVLNGFNGKLLAGINSKVRGYKGSQCASQLILAIL